MFIVSACLAGFSCRWDGGSCSNPTVETLVRTGEAIPACPEQLGGLGTPRVAAEICSGDGLDVLRGKSQVLSLKGDDVTENFLRGAREFLKIAEKYGIKEAILKQGSPSCGFGKIVRKGKETGGVGITAGLMQESGIRIIAMD